MHMCSRCDQIEIEIEQLRHLISPGIEALSLAMIQCAIESLEADREEVKHHGSPPL